LAAAGALAAGTGGVSLFNVRSAYSKPAESADVLATLNVGKFVRRNRDQYKLGDNGELWIKIDWIRTAD
jgi:hypothetical protein